MSLSLEKDSLFVSKIGEQGKKVEENRLSDIQSHVRAFTDTRFEDFDGETQIALLGCDDFTERDIRELSDFYRLIFANDWGDFLVCQDCSVHVSPSEFFGCEEGEVEISMLDSVPENCPCPNCSEQMKLFHDPVVTYENIKAKLSFEGSYAVVLKSKEGKILAMFIGFAAPLRDVFNLEWINEYNYMKLRDQNPNYDRSLDDLILSLKKTDFGADISEDTIIYCFSSIVVDKNVRGKKYFFKTTDKLLEPFREGKLDPSMVILGHTVEGSKSDHLFRAVNAIPVHSLEDGLLVFAGPVNACLDGLKKFL